MSIDVEDQLSRLPRRARRRARRARAMGITRGPRRRRPSPSRAAPKVALAVAVAAALLLLSGTALIMRDRRGGAPVGTLRTASDATSAPTVPSKPTGTWDPSGPRLTDAELAQVITPVAGPNGTTVWRPIEPNGQPSQRGAVTGLSIVRTTLAQCFPHEPLCSAVTACEAASLDATLLHYLASLTIKSTNPRRQSGVDRRDRPHGPRAPADLRLQDRGQPARTSRSSAWRSSAPTVAL